MIQIIEHVPTKQCFEQQWCARWWPSRLSAERAHAAETRAEGERPNKRLEGEALDVLSELKHTDQVTIK